MTEEVKLINWDRYFKDLGEQRAPGTVVAYTYTLKKFQTFLEGREPTQELAEDFLEVFKEKSNRRSILRHIVALRHLFSWLGIKVNMKSPYLERNLPAYITEAEFTHLINNARDLKLRAALALLFGGGLRLSEAVNLEITDINLEGYIRVMGKGRKERLVPVEDYIIKEVRPWLDIVRNYSKFVFPGYDRNRPRRKGGFQKMIRNHMRACGILGKRCHSFRHGAATSLYSRGMELRQIQELLGHENLATTAIYTHLAPGRLREDMLKAKRFKDNK